MRPTVLRLTREHVRFSLLCVLFAFLFRIPIRSPAEDAYYLVESAFFLFVGAYFAVYLAHAVFRRRPVARIELLCLSLLLVPLIAAILTLVRYGQPIIYGLGSQREFLGILAAVLVLDLLRRGSIDMDLVRRSLVTVAWLTLGAWVFVYLFVDYGAFAKLGGYVSTSALRGERLRFDRVITAFLAIYCTVAAARSPGLKTYAAFAVCIWYVFFVTLSRSYAVAYLFAVFLFLWDLSARVRGRRIKYATYAVFAAMLVAVVPLLVSPSLQDYLQRSFGSAFKVVLSGEPAEDPAASVRVLQAEIAWPYIKAHPLLGNGKLSFKWDLSVIADRGRFDTHDLGILGGLYLYGVLGLALLLLPYLYAIRWFRAIHADNADPFIVACKYFVVYYLVRTVLTNFAAQRPPPGILMLVLTYYWIVERPFKRSPPEVPIQAGKA